MLAADVAATFELNGSCLASGEVVTERSTFGANYTKRPVMPKAKKPCPCGSGETFKKCCRPLLDDLPHHVRPFQHFDEDPEGTLRLLRAEFTRYQIWHATNTVPWYRSDAAAARELLEIDTEALGDYLGQLRYVYEQLDRLGEFDSVLVQCEDLIPTPRWKAIITRERLVAAFAAGGDPKARHVAADIPVDDEYDAELLSLVLPYRDDLSVSARLRLIDRVVDGSDDWEERVRHLTYRGLLWELHGDPEAAKKSYAEAVESLPADPDPAWSHVVVIEALVLSGRSNDRESDLERALELCERYLAENADDAALHQGLRKSRADTLKRMGEDARALEDLKWLVEARGTNDDAIQLGQAYVATEQYELAPDVLENVAWGELTPGEKYDYAHSLFGLLFGFDDEDLRQVVRQRLEMIDPEFPIWRETRDRLLLYLAKTERGRLPGWWATIRESVILQPNVFGFGIDLSKLIDRALVKTRDDAEDSAHRALIGKGDGSE